ncbi:MAG: hypothetical protein ACOZE5_18015 [Verrucomicrobiota bacterium]
MDSFANYHHRLWTWSGLVLARVVRFTSWWVGAAFVVWMCGVTLTPAGLITNCVIQARAGELDLSEVFSTVVLSAMAIPLIRKFPPSEVWALIKILWRGLPFILNVVTFGLFRVAPRLGARVKAVATGLPANCEARKVQMPAGPAWGVVQRRDGERWARVIATGASPEDARRNARKILGLD